MNKLDKMYNVVRVCRRDLVENGMSQKKALALTDTQMRKIAQDIADGLCGSGNFADCCWYAVDAMKSK